MQKQTVSGVVHLPHPYRIDLQDGRLLRADETVALRPKTWAVLCYLIEHPNTLVKKADLLDTVWAGLAVTEDTLTKSIGELRQAFGDDPRKPRFIETVHRRGFRFIAPMQPEHEDEPVGGSTVELPSRYDSTPTCFAGRESELRRLQDHLAHANRGQRQVVFLNGEPGIGKSALVDRFIDFFAEQRADIHCARGFAIDQFGVREPYFPYLDALGRLSHTLDTSKFVELLGRCAPSWLAQMSWLADTSARVDMTQQLAFVRPERMLRELAVFLEELTRDRTLVLILEDLHWADHASVELLEMLAQRREPARLLVLATYRRAEAVVREHPLLRTKQILQMRRACSEVVLSCLERSDIVTYLGQRFAGADFPAGLANLLYAHTDGNPLFMVAVTDQLVSRGWIVDTAPGWGMTVPLETLHLEVPDHVREMISMQFQSLSPADQRLLQACSVAGFGFDLDEVAAAIDMDFEEAESACARLARAHRMLRIADDTVPGRYSFLHSIYEHVVYHDLPEGQRRRLHQRIGEVLELRYQSKRQEVASKLASHFERSGDHNRAIQYLVMAAERARLRQAPREVAAYLHSALEIAGGLDDESERKQHQRELHLMIGPALVDLYGYADDRVFDHYQKTRSIYAGGSLRERYIALHGLCFSQATRGDKSADDTAMELVELARRTGDAQLTFQSESLWGRILTWSGRFTAACEVFESLITAWRGTYGLTAAPEFGVEPIVTIRSHYAFSLWPLGYVNRANDAMQHSLALASNGLPPFTVVASLVHSAYLQYLCRDPRHARVLAVRAHQLAIENEVTQWLGMARALYEWSTLMSNQGDGDAEGLREGVRFYESTGNKNGLPILKGMLAIVEAHQGRLAEALALMGDALQICSNSLERMHEAELWRLNGELLLAQAEGTSFQPYAFSEIRSPIPSRNFRKLARVEESFERAIAVARADEARSFELRAAMSLTRLRIRQGKSREAFELLDPIYGWFTEGFDSRDLLEAAQLRTSLSGSATHR